MRTALAVVSLFLAFYCGGCVTIAAWRSAASPLYVEQFDGYLVDQKTEQHKGIVVKYSSYDIQDNWRPSQLEYGAGYLAAMWGFGGHDDTFVVPTDTHGSLIWPNRLAPKARTAETIWAEIPVRQKNAVQRQKLKLYFYGLERGESGREIEAQGFPTRGRTNLVSRPHQLFPENCSILYYEDTQGGPQLFEGSLAQALDSPSIQFVLVPRQVGRPTTDAIDALAKAVLATPFLLCADCFVTPMLIVASAGHPMHETSY